MEFLTLGPLEVVANGRPLRLGGPKQRAVLARLLLEANRVVPTDVLVEQLWGPGSPPNARPILQVYIANLRKVLADDGTPRGKRLERQSSGYVIRADPDELDVARFHRLTADGRQALYAGDVPTATAKLREALALWRGPAFPDLTDAATVPADVAALESERLAALEDRIRADLDAGRHAEVIPELDALTTAHPLRERLQAHRITALYRSGRQADALDAYQAIRFLLRKELGVDPGPELQRLETAVLRHDPGLDGPNSAGPPARGPPAAPAG
jgi:DNA-binding SARP family transcriptional activator